MVLYSFKKLNILVSRLFLPQDYLYVVEAPWEVWFFVHLLGSMMIT